MSRTPIPDELIYNPYIDDLKTMNPTEAELYACKMKIEDLEGKVNALTNQNKKLMDFAKFMHDRPQIFIGAIGRSMLYDAIES